MGPKTGQVQGVNTKSGPERILSKARIAPLTECAVVISLHPLVAVLIFADLALCVIKKQQKRLLRGSTHLCSGIQIVVGIS